MTKAFSVMQRAAALLAALCLLAGMALPVYAEGTQPETSAFVQDVETIQSEETLPAQSDAETPADEQDADTAGDTDTAEDTGSPDDVTDADADTADSDDSGENADSADSSENTATPAPAEDTDIPADATPTPTATEPPAPTETPLPTAAPTPTPEPTPTVTPTVVEDEGESGEENTTIPANNEIATYADLEEGKTYTFYFAPPASWNVQNGDTVTFIGKRGANNSSNCDTEISRTMSRVDGYTTSDKRPIYVVNLRYKNKDSSAECSWGGYYYIKFSANGHSIQMYGPGTDTNRWLLLVNMHEHVFDAGSLNDDVDSLNDGTYDTWQADRLKSYADVAKKHVAYGGQTISFENKTENALTDIKVTFYEKDGDKYNQVGDVQTIPSIAAKETYTNIVIPPGPCSYVSFTGADDNPIGKKYYNFYGEETDSADAGSFQYDKDTNYCLIYSGADNVTWGDPNSIRVFFDATFSHMSYKNDASVTEGMPGSDNTLWCIVKTDSDTQKLEMTRDGSSEIWYVNIPGTSTRVQFSNAQALLDAGRSTTVQTLTDEIKALKEPCFYADTSDDVIYGTGYRDGYWDEKTAIRDAEKGKNKQVVQLDKAPFKQKANTKYVNTTLYDYYTDYELNGNNRAEYPHTGYNDQRSYVTFEQFDRALSNYYADYAGIDGNTISSPIYTGHFQLDGWDSQFKDVAGNLNLYGWAEEAGDKTKYYRFMAVNNSNLNAKGDGKTDGTHNTYKVFQGLVNDTKPADGEPTLRGTTLTEPHFNEAFLTGTNDENAVLGKVYKNVAFPFTKSNVFKGTKKDHSSEVNPDEAVAQYWYYNSNETSLYLKQDSDNYYLEGDGTDRKSLNRNSKNDTNQNDQSKASNVYGFFPFNKTDKGANQYNYGFGAKLEFEFTLTEDGNVVVGTDTDTSKDKTVPIRFFFSGDDDVWVFIDNQLALDVGGAHGKAAGLLEFGSREKENDDGTTTLVNTMTPYVNDAKDGEKNGDTWIDGILYTYKGDNDTTTKTVNFNGTEYLFKFQGNTQDLAPGKHTLTMYYMERGMWESNMAVAFNFPDHNELQVEKQVDTTDVRDALKPYFTNSALKQFTVGIKNWATHYPTLDLAATTAKDSINLNTVGFTAARLAEGGNTKTNYLRIGESPGGDTDDEKSQTVHWYASMDDRGDAKNSIKCSGYRGKRYGSINLKETIDVSGMDYLSFQVYAPVENAYGSNQKAGALSVSYMYLQLVDTNDKTMGCLGLLDDNTANTSYLYGKTIGNTAMQNDQWCTLKLDMSKLPAEEEFDSTSVKSIRVGYDYQRNIYFRNFTFVDVPQVVTNTGFTTKQYNITDYDSVKAGGLMNAVGAKFTSSVDDKTYTVDTDGTFDLQNGETVTFVDQFRRGSYISLKEYTDTNLFDTTWEIYENGSLVTQNQSDSAVEVEAGAPQTMRGNNTTPDDGRKEVYKEGTDEDGQTIPNGGYKGTQKPTEKSIVFRSYIDPDGTDQFTKLKVKFINKVRTGSLSITKQVPEDEYADLKDETYTFTVRYTNIGGLGLEGDAVVTETVEVQVGQTVTLDKIPLGTIVTVTENDKPNRYIKSITVNEQSADGEAHGSIDADTTDGDQTIPSVRVVFTNTARKLIDIDVEKKWQDAQDNELTSDLPTSIWVKLQRRHAGSTNDKDWTDVPDTIVELTKHNYDGTWKHTFTGMDAYDTSHENRYYEYRVLESAVKSGPYTEAGKTLTLGGYKYKVDSTAQTIKETDNSASLILTNTQVPPVYELAITKQGLDENGSFKELLNDVEFKLEKLNDNGNIDTSFKAVTGKTTGDGENAGKYSFTGLPAGKYRLTELKTVDGYNLLAAPIEFVLQDGKCLINGMEQDIVEGNPANGYTVSLTINNRKGFTLPHTGADAPSLWLLIGLPLLVAGLLVLVFRYNRKGGKRS